MNQQNRTRLVGIITEYRSKWDAAGVEAAIKTLDLRHPNDPLYVVALAVAAARDPHALTPAAMHARPVDSTPVAPAVKAAPRYDDPECAVHGGTTRDIQSRFTCCTQANATPRPTSPVPPSLRPACPAPAGLREQVAQALNVRTVVGANPKEGEDR